MSFGLFPLETATAAELAVELDAVFGDTAEGPLAGVVRVVPIERLNAILVVSAQPAYLDQAETWIERLDRAGEGEEPRDLRLRRAERPGDQSRRGAGRDLRRRDHDGGRAEPAGAGPRAGRAGLDQRVRARRRADRARRTPSSTEPGERAQPERRAPGRARGRSAAASAFAEPASATPESDIRIIADDTTNSLVIQARPREYRKIQQALDKLDVLPLQVLIEATIAEVTLNDELRYGVEWFFRSRRLRVHRLAAGADRRGARFPGFSALFSSDDVRVVLNALEEVTDVNVISSPQLLVLDNQTARLQVGDQVPITIQQATSVERPRCADRQLDRAARHRRDPDRHAAGQRSTGW